MISHQTDFEVQLSPLLRSILYF